MSAYYWILSYLMHVLKDTLDSSTILTVWWCWLNHKEICLNTVSLYLAQQMINLTIDSLLLRVLQGWVRLCLSIWNTFCTQRWCAWRCPFGPLAKCQPACQKNACRKCPEVCELRSEKIYSLLLWEKYPINSTSTLLLDLDRY